MKRRASGGAVWAECYESLRHYVLEGQQRLQRQPLGLALWVAQGMAGWMRQWSQLAEPASGCVVPAPRPRPHLAQAGDWQESLTFLLAQITLQHLEAGVSL
jgi:hypothetical protein